MSVPSAYYLRAAIAFCAVVGLYDVLYTVAFNLDSQFLWRWVLRPVVNHPTPFPDFITPYGALSAWFEGKKTLIYDHGKFAAYLNALYPNLPIPFVLQPFLYPPVWLLMLAPFAVLPVYVSCVVFMVATAAAFAFESRRHLWSWLAVVTSPAAVWVVLSGQNTFLYIALIYGGLRLLDRSPVAAGMLLGLLVYKPQICMLVPLALLASRQWKALAWMLATGTVLVLASVAVLGLDFWLDYVAMARGLSDPAMLDNWASRRSLINISPFVAIRILDLPNGVASAVQACTAIVGVTAVWFAFRRSAPSAARTAVLMAATLLVSPYTINYDLMLLLPVALMLYRQGAATGFYPLEPMLYAVLWLMPTAILWFNPRVSLTPLVVLAFGTIALLRMRTERGPTSSS